MHNISSWAIRHPVTPIVMFLVLLFAGLISFMRLDVNQSPDVSFPVVTVTITQPGAVASELETQVTQKVESAVRRVRGIDEISSTISEGVSVTRVQLAIGTPIDRAVNDIRNVVTQIRSDLPQGILEPQVLRLDVTGRPLAYFSAQGIDMTLEELSWYVDNTVAKALLAVPGMAGVARSGGVDRAINVMLDPKRLQAYGLTASQLNQQLRIINVNAPGGRTQFADGEQVVRILGNAATVHDLKQIQIATPGGRIIRLKDVAQVRDSYAEQRALAKMDGRQVVSFGVSKADSASDVTVFDAVEEELRHLEASNPNITFSRLFTSTDYTKRQYHAAMQALVEGAILAVLVVWLFLRDARATFISALAIPLSAIPTFWFMEYMGFTLNFISLLALSLVAGVLVDDAIVEIENIVRHMRMGKTPWQAALDAADEIGMAVVATTFAIVAVFLPVALMPGVSGQFFKQFGLTVVAAVLVSLAVARLITPLIAAYFLRSGGAHAHDTPSWVHAYARILRWTLVHRGKTMAIAAAALVATYFAFATLSVEFQPATDDDFVQANIALVPGVTLEQTEAVSDRVTQILRAQPEVKHVFANIGVGGASLFVTLKQNRTRTSVQFSRALQPVLNEIPDARIAFQNQSDGGSGRDINLVFTGADPAILEKAVRRVLQQVEKMPEVRSPRIEGDLHMPALIITPRFDLAAQLRVTTASLSDALRVATIGELDQNAAKFSLGDRQIPIRILLKPSARADLAMIENLPVATQRGGSVPLRLVADVKLGSGPVQIRRYGQRRRMIIGMDLAPGLVTGDAMHKLLSLPVMKQLPRGVERVNFGSQKWQLQLYINFAVAVVSGLLLLLVVLVLLYRHFVPPLVNMASLFLAPLGGALALHLTGHSLSLPVFIGLLMLLGIVAKNSILLIDFASKEIDSGIERNAAIIDAGVKRARPIVMTTVAMVAGMVPTSLALIGDGAWRQPMGIVVIGGLILSTVLTLLIVPAAFSLAIGFEAWVARKLSFLIRDRHKIPDPDETPTGKNA